MAREAMSELRQNAESSFGRILDKGQVVRLKQIQLQLQGPTAVVFREDLVDKLQIDEAQIEMVRELMTENRGIQRKTQRARFEVMKTAFARVNPNVGNNRQDGDGGENGEAGGNNGNGNNGRNRGGRGGRGNFDPEAMRKVMEDPAVKAQMEDFRSQDQKLSTQFAAAVNKVLTPRQRTMYKKMLGAPFDRSKMFVGGPWGGRRGNGPGNQAKAKAAPTARANANDDDDEDDETPRAKATTKAPVKAKAAAPRRKSLRELRGDPGNSDD